MTSLTGSTELRSLPDGPPFAAAMLGAGLQLGTIWYVWREHSTASGCMSEPVGCLLEPWRADPWGRTVAYAGFLTIAVWLLSLRSLPSTGTSDPSIVDRLWSIMPVVYMWHWCLAGPPSPRLALMCLLVTIWGARLTYNFWIKGGFSGGEDYRWAVIRRWYPGWKWEAFNLVFICTFQLVEILAFTVPGVAAMQSSQPLGWLDLLATLAFMLLVAGEAVSDRQMFAFQTEKYRRRAAGEDPGPYARGFVESGLWSYSRHPNYFCEVSLWWVFYLFSVAATGAWLNWTIWGALFLSVLFLAPQGSLDVTEMLSKSKYPAYAEYQQRVSCFIPCPPRKAAD